MPKAPEGWPYGPDSGTMPRSMPDRPSQAARRALLALTLCLPLAGAGPARALTITVPGPPPYWSEPPALDGEVLDATFGEDGAAGGEAAPAVTPPRLLFPVPGGRQTGLDGHFAARRGRKRHHAVDIGAPRRTPVRAVANGTIQRLRRSRRGGISVEQVDREGRYCFYYAHLQGYAPRLQVGQEVARDDLLGFVGSTGSARGPHLHFSVLELGGEKECWKGMLIDPYPLLELNPSEPPADEAPARVLAE